MKSQKNRSSGPVRAISEVLLGAGIVMGLGACSGQENKVQISKRSAEFPSPQTSDQIANPAEVKLPEVVQPPAPQVGQAAESSKTATPTKTSQEKPQGESQPKETTTPPKSGDGQETKVYVYDGFFYPQKMKECHENGKIYDRSKLDCHETQKLATAASGFFCNEKGILSAFGGGETLEKTLTSRLDLGWQIDQCGFDGMRKTAYLVCFTEKKNSCNGNLDCKDPKDIDPKETKFCVSTIADP